MLAAILPAAIGAAASLAGGAMNRSAASAANAQIAANNAAQLEEARKNREMQVQFAKEGVRWKVDDARAAGIHPLYALGANTVSFAPVSVGQQSPVVDTSMGSALASAGQDISRAMNATRTAGERRTAFDTTVQQLQLQKMGLENELLASQIAKLRAATNPPMPGPAPEVAGYGPVPMANKWEDTPRLIAGGHNIVTDPKTVSQKAFEDRYGDDGWPSWLSQTYIAWRDYLNTAASNHEREMMNPFHRESRDPVRRWWLQRLNDWR